MSDGLNIKVEGFKELELLIKRLPDKITKNEVNKVLNQIAHPLFKMMQSLVPRSTGFKYNNGKAYRIKKRQLGKTIIQPIYTPGYGRKTIAKKKLRKSKNPLISVGPHTRKGKDGYYLRQWLIPGTVHFKGNDFIEKARRATEGAMLPDAEKRISKYIQKQIDRLN